MELTVAGKKWEIFLREGNEFRSRGADGTDQ